MKPVVLCDIDHTISDAAWRDGMIGKVPWDEYHLASANDPPIAGTAALIRALAAYGCEIVGFTARPDKFRRMTIDWCVKHDIPIGELLMRMDTDFRPAPAIKLALLQDRFGASPSDQILFLLEDREDVIAAFRALGITCLQVHCARQVENQP